MPISAHMRWSWGIRFICGVHTALKIVRFDERCSGVMPARSGGPTAAQVFLPSLQQLSQAIAQNSDATVEAISYRAGVIDVRLTAPDVATLNSIQEIVGNSGQFRASIQSTDQVGDRVSSRIQIREAGA